MFSCFMGLQNKMHMFQEYFLSFNTSKINLPETLLAKLQLLFVHIMKTVLMKQSVYPQAIKPIAKSCVF